MDCIFPIYFDRYYAEQSQMYVTKNGIGTSMIALVNSGGFNENDENTVAIKNSNTASHFDKYGHSEGDCYIRNFVEIAKSHIRTEDIFARIGGDEFCIILRSCKKETAVEKIQHMQKLFANDDKKDYSQNFSFGIIEVPENHDEMEFVDLLKQADAMMYEQKREHKKMFR